VLSFPRPRIPLIGWRPWRRCGAWPTSWLEVAEALGVTRQAVHKKHAKRLIAAGVKLRRRR
jgi:hypothetical protein